MTSYRARLRLKSPASALFAQLWIGTDKKHQSSAPLAFVWGIHRWPVNSLHKGPVTRKKFPFDSVIMMVWCQSVLLIFVWIILLQTLSQPRDCQLQRKSLVHYGEIVTKYPRPLLYLWFSKITVSGKKLYMYNIISHWLRASQLTITSSNRNIFFVTGHLGTLKFSLMCAWTNGWAITRDPGGLRRNRAHCDVTVMFK